MVLRTLRPCRSQPCSALVVSGRCAKHAAIQRQHAATLSDLRPGRIESKPFYSSRRWRACRAAFLSEHPLCRICLDATPRRLTPACEVDHMKPIRAGGERFDWANLQALCKPCHSRKTRSEDHACS